MADYTNAKSGVGDVYPTNVNDSDWRGLQPLITPEQLKVKHLFGIPLVSAIVNPLTKRVDIMDDPKLKDYILEAVGLAELEAKFDIFPKQYKEKHAFDRAAYDMFGYMQMRHRPISSIDSLQVVPSNEQPVFEVPLEWVDVGYLHEGQINLIPLTIAVKGGTVVPLTSSAGGATWLSIMGNRPWVPSMWEVLYTVGFSNGLVPGVVNQYIGVISAMEILSALAATYSRSNSMSLGIDGLSQSVSMPGSDIFTVRLTQLAEKRQWLKSRLQASFGNNIIVDNV